MIPEKRIPFAYSMYLTGDYSLVTAGGDSVKTIVEFILDTEKYYVGFTKGKRIASTWDTQGFEITRSPKLKLYMCEKLVSVSLTYPSPIQDPLPVGTVYWIPSILSGDPSFHKIEWIGSENDDKRLVGGVIHLSPENAIRHAEAILGTKP